MKQQLKYLFLAFMTFDFMLGPLRDWLLGAKTLAEIFSWTSNPHYIYLILTSLLVLLVYTFGAYLAFFKTYNPQKKYLSFGLLPVIALAGIGIRYLMQEVGGLAIFGKGNYNEGTSMGYYIFDNLYYVILYMSLGTVFFFIQYAQHKEAQQQALILQNQKTELAYLRSQLNPHFLFNILNNIYSLIYYKSDNALRSVEKLSSLLRYGLYEKADKVTVKKEVAHLYDFIELQKMRFDYELALDIQIAENVQMLKIVPLLFIPFVENAFKHGNLKDPSKPMLIRLEQNATDLIFTVENEKRAQQKDEVGGIGLENIQQRLALIYGEKANLAIDETEAEFKIKLKIATTEC